MPAVDEKLTWEETELTLLEKLEERRSIAIKNIDKNLFKDTDAVKSLLYDAQVVYIQRILDNPRHPIRIKQIEEKLELLGYGLDELAKPDEFIKKVCIDEQTLKDLEWIEDLAKEIRGMDEWEKKDVLLKRVVELRDVIKLWEEKKTEYTALRYERIELQWKLNTFEQEMEILASEITTYQTIMDHLKN